MHSFSFVIHENAYFLYFHEFFKALVCINFKHYLYSLERWIYTEREKGEKRKRERSFNHVSLPKRPRALPRFCTRVAALAILCCSPTHISRELKRQTTWDVSVTGGSVTHCATMPAPPQASPCMSRFIPSDYHTESCKCQFLLAEIAFLRYRALNRSDKQVE